jgi:hypothetical protein
VEGDVHPALDRDLPAEQALGRGGVVVQAVTDVARLPAGVADRVARVVDLEPRELLDVGVHHRGEGAQQAGPLLGGHGAPGQERLVRTGDRGVGLLDAGGADLGDPLSGDRADHRRGVGRGHVAHILSKVRASSQSVTAASKAASSTSAMLT